MTIFEKYSSTVMMSLSLLLNTPTEALDIGIHTDAGEYFVLEFDPNNSIQSLFESIALILGDEKDYQVNMEINNEVLQARACVCSKGQPRNYYAPLSASEKKDLGYILRTLANNSLAKIAKEKSSLNKAGDRLNHLHPFKFLEAIFIDEELKVCVRNIEGKSWVWSEFLSGITGSLSKESAVDNLKIEYIQNLSSLLSLDINSILPTIQDKNWSKFVTDLISLVPRNGDSNRYNM